MWRATNNCEANEDDRNALADHDCYMPLHDCTGLSGWCDCNGNADKDDGEKGFNCTELNATVIAWRANNPGENLTCFSGNHCTLPGSSLLSISEQIEALQTDEEGEWEY